MALRILTYICLTYEELLRRKELKAGDRLPWKYCFASHMG